ncbi:MAG: polysaccharide biosynthesis tyrosine autokinase [Kastovskya adunca ATA6-11-RM4]|jgi:capsular exopolysaccharide synthesis family protein|nr:polysaccharide biosynthesis tyrosine autokinase [Kastovskya adunca ATA6-11-RM4]
MESGNNQGSLSSNGNGKNGNPVPSLPLMYQNQFSDTADELNLRQLVVVARRRALVIAGVAIAVTSAVAFWTFNRTPQYASKFQLLVEPVAGESKLDQLTSGVPGVNPERQGSSLDYETQVQVLRSSNLMLPIIEELQTRYPNITYDELMSGNGLTITRLGETKILEVSYRNPDPKKVQFVLHEVAKGYLRYSLRERQLNVNQGLKFVEAQLPTLRTRVDKLQGDLQDFRQRYNLLDPENQATELSQRVSTIDQQRLATQVELQETQTLYTTISRQLNLSPNQAIATAALSEAPRYQSLLNQLQEVEAKIAIELARFTEESPSVEALREQQRNLLPLLQQEAQNALGQNLSTAGVSTTSPSSIRLQLTQELVNSANQLKVLQVRQNAIATAQSGLEQQVKFMPVIARRYTDLQRELGVATESLNRFLGVQETLEIEAAQKALPWQLLLKPQEPKFPVSPNTQRNLTLGAIAGLLLGMGAALLIERLDNVFHSPDELKDTTKLPLLGIIPYHKKLRQMTSLTSIAGLMSKTGNVADNPAPRGNRRQLQWYNASPFLEAFRSLHTNIRFLGSDTPVHSLVISSATPADGKSTTAVHLAQAAAAMGQRVLLVDADLRRPQVHHILELENHQGLSNVIATGVPAKQAIQRLPMWDHLYVLTAGQLPPDPTRLLCSKKMGYLMEQFHAVFDLVIYDTPPLLGLADSRLLAAHSDGVVVVVGLGRTDRSAIMQALDGLKLSSATVLGVVANGVKNHITTSSYYHQRYYAQESEVEKAKQLLQKRMG